MSSDRPRMCFAFAKVVVAAFTAILAGSYGQSAFAADWLTTNELKTLYANVSVDAENLGKSLHFEFKPDRKLSIKVGEKNFQSFWWLENPDIICTPTQRTETGKLCWRHKKNDPSRVRYRTDRDEALKIYSYWRIKENAKTSAELVHLSDSPNEEALDRFFGDNLGSYTTDSPEEKVVRDSLAAFQQSLLAADGSSLQSMVSEDFKQIEEFQGKTLSAFDRTQAFDLDNQAGQYKKIEFSLKSVAKDVPPGAMTAIVVSSYHGKYFTKRYLETYSFGYDKSVGKLQRQMRTRLSVTNPKLHDVQIHVRRQVSKNAIKAAFASPDVDSKLDKILGDTYDKFPNWEDVSVLFVFREPPRIGSTVRTHIRFTSFEYKVTTADPYFLIANEAKYFFGKSRASIAVFVDNELVAFRSMAH